MKRKIIKQGHNTLTVTLPSDWAKRFNLKAGEEINLIERENGLFLSSERINIPNETEINIKDLSIPLIWKHLVTAYRAGYDKITIKFSPNDIYDNPYKYFAHFISDNFFAKKEKLTPNEFIHQMTDRFVGLEVIDHGKDYCVLKEIGQPTSKEFDSSLRRIFLLLLYLSEGIIEDLKKGSRDFLDKAHNIDTQIDKFHDFCVRVLNKTGFEEPSKNSIIFTLIFVLELVGDEFKHLAIQLREKDKEKTDFKKIISSLDSINEQFKIFYEIYYSYSIERLKELFELNRTFVNGASKKNGYKEDTQVTIETINRYINVLSELLIAKQQTQSK